MTEHSASGELAKKRRNLFARLRRREEEIEAVNSDQIADERAEEYGAGGSAGGPHIAAGEQDALESEDRHAVVELQNVSLSFDKPVLRDVSLVARESETLLIAGESGTGKTTILRLILRLLVPDTGLVLVNGRDITRLKFQQALEIRTTMGMVFQGAALFDSLTVFENVAYPLREHSDLSDDEIEKAVSEKLSFVDLDPEEVGERLPSELSGGMKKRVGIARAIASNPQLMLYDEPTGGLDPLTTGTIVELMHKLQMELGVTSIIVSHDMRAILPIANRVALLADQRIRFFGTPEEMLSTEDRYIQVFLGEA